jgi:hypothetical protein
MESRKKSKYTKNKELIRIIRDYEIELNRPKGLKLLDKMISVMPESHKANAFYVSKKIHKECNFITKYKGYFVWCVPINNW